MTGIGIWELLERMELDDSEIRAFVLHIAGTDREFREIPLRCSRAQARAIKLAVFAAGGDALAIPEDAA